MNKQDWAYLAGILDGEGYVTVNKAGARLEVASTEVKLIDWMCARIGGSRTQYQPKNLKYKLTYKWATAKRDHVEWVLSNCVPYMIIKRPQAQAVLQYLQDNPADTKLREEYTSLLTILNKKGVE